MNLLKAKGKYLDRDFTIENKFEADPSKYEKKFSAMVLVNFL